MTKLILCKVILNSNRIRRIQSIVYESVVPTTSELENLIESDKQYGFLKRKTGNQLTVTLKNTDDEIAYSDAKKAVIDGYFEWELETNLNLIFLKDKTATSDIRIEFRTQAEDSLLTSNTIAYMYYPMNGPFPNRGLMVVNKRFIYTNHGNTVTGKWMLDHGINVQFPDNQYATIDLDKIFRHEFGHGIFGLQHDPLSDNLMSSSEGQMSEFTSSRDATRAVAKAGKSTKSEKFILTMRNWFRISGSER